MGIPHRVARGDEAAFLVLVEADEATRARQTLDAFDEEERQRRAMASPAPAPDPTPWQTGLWVGLLLLVAFALTGPPRAASPWFERGAAAAGPMLAAEPWRAVTALTLHADVAHVAGNAIALALLVPAIGQRLGAGLAVAVVLLGGATGNGLAAMAHAPGHRAVGASTAAFAAIGILAGLRLLPARHRRQTGGRIWVAPVAGLVLLALLGGGRGVDVLAHAFGLLSGLGCGLVAALMRRPGPRAQQALGALAALAIVVAWWLAFGDAGSARAGRPSGLDPDEQVASVLLHPIDLHRRLGVPHRGARAQVELPEVLETGEHPAVVHALGEGHLLMRAQGLAGEELSARGGDHDRRPALDGHLLQALRRDLVPPARALPHGRGLSSQLNLS
jgi:membrane associated rhomboid family serine protease